MGFKSKPSLYLLASFKETQQGSYKVLVLEKLHKRVRNCNKPAMTEYMATGYVSSYSCFIIIIIIKKHKYQHKMS